jgi:glycosyltransferase involved in cell wall biosynthesis
MITHFGRNNRDHILLFQDSFLKRNLEKNAIYDQRMCTEKLGRNFSAFLYEKNGKKLLVLLDIDDGSGGTPSDCKIIWSTLFELQQHYKPHDMIILKSQVNRNPEYNQFYPFKEDVYPIGIFSNDPSKVFFAKEKYVHVEQDIDVFYAGGYKHVKNRPYCWPKNRDIRKWWAGSSIKGYEKLLEIKQKRPDIKFALFDDSLPAEQFYSLMRRSKVCVDLPGIGLSSRKFYECMVFGKCVLSLRQQYTPWPCEENIHYCSMEEDLDYESMEQKIDLLLKNEELRFNIEKNVDSIKNHLTLESMILRIEKIINQKIENINSYVIQY